MHVHLIQPRAGLVEARPIDQRTQIFEGNSSIEMGKRSFDHLLELRAVQGPAIRQPEEMTPGLGGKTPPLMRPHYPKSHPHSPEGGPAFRQAAPPFRKRRNPENATASKSTTANPLIGNNFRCFREVSRWAGSDLSQVWAANLSASPTPKQGGGQKSQLVVA